MNSGRRRSAQLYLESASRSGAQPTHPLQYWDALATYHTLQNGQIEREQSLLKNYWFVFAGTAKQYLVYPDGRYQITDILLPGDFSDLAMPADVASQHFLEGVADPTLIISYPRNHIDELAAFDLSIANQLHAMTLGVLVRVKRHLLTLGQLTAISKVSSFILEMKARLAVDGADAFDLPVARCDVARYLGISVETVSRSLSVLREQGAIRLVGNRRVIVTSHDVILSNIQSEEVEHANHACCRRRVAL